MGNDAARTVIGADGQVYVGPLGSTAPTGVTDTPDSAFVELGYISEDGVRFARTPQTQDYFAWQSLDPIRTVVLRATFTATFALQEWSTENLSFATGGGDWDTVSDGFLLHPADASLIDYRALIIDFQDGSRNFRVFIPKCLVSEAVEIQVTRQSLAVMPITVRAVKVDDSTDVWDIRADDNSGAFEATGS